MATKRPSYKQVREYLDYDRETGLLSWKKKTGNKGWVGKPAGSLKSHGYIAIQILGMRCYAHQLAWLWMTERWPREIDHKNGSRGDNRWENLREASRFLNNGNRKLGYKHKNFDLPKGVLRLRDWRSGGVYYQGRITIRNKTLWLGRRPTPELAHKDYMVAATKYFGAFARAA